jgi:hypothetical protein
MAAICVMYPNMYVVRRTFLFESWLFFFIKKNNNINFIVVYWHGQRVPGSLLFDFCFCCRVILVLIDAAIALLAERCCEEIGSSLSTTGRYM